MKPLAFASVARHLLHASVLAIGLGGPIVLLLRPDGPAATSHVFAVASAMEVPKPDSDWSAAEAETRRHMQPWVWEASGTTNSISREPQIEPWSGAQP